MNRSLLGSNSLLRRITALGLAIMAGSVSWAVDSVSTLAGSTAGFTNATGTAAKFQLSSPAAAVVDGSGNIYVADTLNNVIRVITPAGVVTTFAGTGSAGLADGTGTTSVQFNGPRGLAIDGAGNIYVADTGNNAIRQITPGGVVTTITSTGGLSSPRGIAANRAGGSGAATKLFVSDSGNNVIRQIDLSGPTVTLVAGTVGQSGYVNDGSGINVQFQNPVGILSDSAGNTLYVADEQNHAIRTVTVSSGATTTLAGAGPSDSGAAADTEGTGTSARFRNPIGLAFDTSGNILVTDRLSNTVRRVTTAGATSLVAGTALSAGSTDGLALSVARFNTPSGIAANSTAIYVVDTNNQRIRMVTSGNAPAIGTQPTNQTVTAGNTATFTVSGVSGTPTPNLQWQISTDSGNNWSNLSNSTIGGGTISGVTTSQLSILTSGTTLNGALFRVVATNGVGTGATSSSVSLTVNAVASGTSPNFVSVSSTTFVVNQGGTFTVQASGDPAPTYGYTGDFPTWANLNLSTGVITGTPPDTSGSPFNFTVTATNTAGSASQSFTLTVSATALAPQISTQPTSQTVGLGQNATFTVVASGNPSPNYQWQRLRSGDSGYVALSEGGNYSGTSSATLTVSSVTSAMSGDQFQVVVSNTNGTSTSSAVQLTVTLGTVWSTVAGQVGVTGYADGTGTAAKFLAPNAIAVDSSGNAYVADAGNHVIRKVTTTGVVTTYAGVPNSAGSTDTDTANGIVGKLNTPSALAFDSQGNLYVADSGNHAIRKVTGGFITTIAGQPGTLGFADGLGTAARFAFPSGIAIDSAGSIYVADTLNQVIRKIVGGSVVQTIAGTQNSAGAVDGAGSGVKFNFPNGLAVDSALNVYVADSRNHAIRKITPSGVVSTYAGLMGLSGSTDGTGSGARFNQPEGVAIDPSGVMYVADTFNQTIRRISTSAEVTTIGGVALAIGSADGAANTARFNQPYGIAVDTGGNLWVADTFNHTVRRSGALTAPSITTQPTAQVAGIGGSATFTVAASGVPTPGFQWQRKAKDSSDFINLTDGGSYSGTATATLTVSNITSEMSGDEFRAIAANLVSPNAESSSASLTVVAPPVFTSSNNATFRVGDAGSFTVTTTSDRTVTYSAVGLPVGVSINSSTGVISGTPVSTSGSPFTVIITANNGTSSSSGTSQTFTLTVEPAQVPPTITTQPTAVSVNRGETVTLTGAASGTAPLSYQWLKNGGAINGATATTLTIPNAQESAAGFYTLKATNPFGNATSMAALVSINTLPVLVSQPRTQTVLQGSSVTFTAGALGSSATTYQWRKNGVAIAGANGSSYSISSVAATDAGNYDVVVTNPLGQVTSSVAQLTVATTAVAPVFTLQPVSLTAVAGSNVTLSAAASGAPAATYQWRKDGVAINNATDSTLSLGAVTSSSAGNYSVVASNSAGSATSESGFLRVIARSYAGIYFGSFGSNLGTFAIFVREDNTGVFLGYLPGNTAPVVSFNIGVNDAGQFSFSQTAIASSGNEGEPARAAALNPVTVSGTIGSDGTVSGSISGGASATLSAARSPSTGTSQNYAGYYQSAAGSSAAVAYTIVGANGTAFAFVQSGAATDGGTGTVNNSGQVSISTGRTTINETIIAGPSAITTQLSGALNGTLAGAAESVLGAQRLANISSRARVVGSASKAIAGFVITGNESKPVLIRAVGPTLNSAFGITSALTTPVLDLYRGASLISSNTGVASLGATARDAITAAGAQAGAFALGSSGGDSAILTTLAPGNYTAQVSGGGNSTGIVLVEVYDLSSASTGQKLLNISTLANTGSGLDTLTAGVVVTGSVPKRVLIRAVGPGLAQLGVTGYLTNPTLQLIQGTQTITQNTDWNNSADKAAISAAAPTVGAFPLVTGDSAMIVSLNPGNYTAQVVSTTGGTGIAIVEIYELP